MIDRRQFLAKSATAISIPVLAKPLAAVATQPGPAFETIILDERIPGNDALMRTAHASGLQCVSIRGDLPKLWFDSLRSTLHEQATVIAGITSDLDAEVMRTFARDVGYQQTARIDISVDSKTSRAVMPQPNASVKHAALSSGLEQLVDYYITMPMRARDLHDPVQLAAWVIAPINSTG